MTYDQTDPQQELADLFAQEPDKTALRIACRSEVAGRPVKFHWLRSAQITDKATTPQETVRLARTYLEKARAQGAASGEHTVATIVLDSANNILGFAVHPEFDRNASADLRQPAMLLPGAAIVACYFRNGDPQPTEEERLDANSHRFADKNLGVRCVDHLLITPTDYFSFAENSIAEMGALAL